MPELVIKKVIKADSLCAGFSIACDKLFPSVPNKAKPAKGSTKAFGLIETAPQWLHQIMLPINRTRSFTQ